MPIPTPEHTHTNSHTHKHIQIHSWYKYGRVPQSGEDPGPCEEFGSGEEWKPGVPSPRIHVACLSPSAVRIMRNASCLFIYILHNSFRPGHTISFQYKFVERLNK